MVRYRDVPVRAKIKGIQRTDKAFEVRTSRFDNVWFCGVNNFWPNIQG